MAAAGAGAYWGVEGALDAILSLDAKGLENGLLENRIVSPLQAAAALPIKAARATRETVNQCPEDAPKRMFYPNRTQPRWRH